MFERRQLCFHFQFVSQSVSPPYLSVRRKPLHLSPPPKKNGIQSPRSEPKKTNKYHPLIAVDSYITVISSSGGSKLGKGEGEGPQPR